MDSVRHSLVPAILLLVTAVHAQKITVSPSCSSSSCITLPELTVPSSGSVALVLLPGVHAGFPSRLTIQGRVNFSIAGTPEETIVSCTAQRSPNLLLRGISNIVFKDVIFEGCNIEISNSNNTKISQCTFVNGTNGALEFSNSLGICINRSTFINNHDSSFGGVLEITRSRNIAITRSNFTDSIVSSFGAVIGIQNSTGYISCCKFRNNSMRSFSGVVKAESGSIVFVTNSSFVENRVDAFGGVNLCESGASITVISCVFDFNVVDSFAGAVKVDGCIGSVLASAFSHNRAGGFGGTIAAEGSAEIAVDCTQFSNTSANSARGGSTIEVQNSDACAERYALGEQGICLHSECEGKTEHISSLPKLRVVLPLLAISYKPHPPIICALEVCSLNDVITNHHVQ